MKKTKTLKPLIFWLIYAGVIAVTILIDQLTKHFIDIATFVEAGKPRRDIPLIGDWLLLHWTTNDGATAGIFRNLEWRNILFFIMTVIGLPVFGYLLWRSRTRSVWGQVAFSFMIGGTLGNAIDRLFLAENGFFTGSVRDFVQVTWFFGIFNMADSFLVVGVILALLAIVFFDPDSLLKSVLEEKRKKTAEAQENATESETVLNGEDNKSVDVSSESVDTTEQNDADD
ncbi:MAG: signal peptidase II [Corallococcus sp.]|nr:signal peptidase II [Bacillota bacterium]MCM1533689.1 signal peptidase II [Corallococcus sp.]